MRLGLNHPDHIRCLVVSTQIARGVSNNAAAYARSHTSRSCAAEQTPGCRDSRREVLLPARAAEGEPGGGQVQPAAERHVWTSALILFLPTLGKSLGRVTRARVAACVRRSL